MKITILNKEEFKNLFQTWGTFACNCYDTPVKYAKTVGKKCLEAGHFSGSRSAYVNLLIEDVPRSMVDQLVRHEQGVVKNVQSLRYVNKSDMTYSTSSDILKNPKAKEIYDKNMKQTREDYINILKELEKCGITGEKAQEQARGILGLDINTSVTIGFTIEALIHFMHKRLCTCSQEYIRILAKEIKKQIAELVPETDEYLVPHCQYLLWCPEDRERSCGIKPVKEDLIKMLESLK